MQSLMTLLGTARATAEWSRARVSNHPSLHRVFAPVLQWFESLATCRVPVPVPIPVPMRRPKFHAMMLATLLGVLALAPMQASAARQDWGTNNGYRPYGNVDYTADGQLVDVQVLVEGRNAPLYLAPGRSDREYFQAFQGRNYSLVLHNNSGRRVGVLIAVDGLNVVSGRQSSLSPNEAMYVLDPWETATINGWRTSTSEIRRFVFVDEQRSYAERTGQANGDLGWIRVLSFAEAVRYRPYDEPQVRRGWPESDGLDGPRAGSPTPPPESSPTLRKPDSAPRTQMGFDSPREDNSNPGTGWGDRSWDPVHRTWFDPQPYATDHLVLRYEYASGLRALGIDVRNRNRLWQRERGELGFAQPPRW